LLHFKRQLAIQRCGRWRKRTARLKSWELGDGHPAWRDNRCCWEEGFLKFWLWKE
jgi:hypothetical protein